jgi:hypothetical protein
MYKPAITYFLLLLAATLACALKPVSEWDEIPYMCLVRHDHNSAAVYADLKQRLSVREYAILTGTGDGHLPPNAYKQAMVSQPESLAEQFPFYKVKPIFLAIAWMLVAVGVSAFTALHLISACAFFVTGCVIWSWISKYAVGWAAVPIAVTILLQPFMIQTARALLPDALGLALVVGGAYCVSERHQTRIGYGLLLLSILDRPDNVIFCVLVFALYRALLPLVAAIALYFSNNYFAHSYSWAKLFTQTFVHPLTMPKEAVVRVSARLYFDIFFKNTLNLATHSELLLILAISLWIAIAFPACRKYLGVCLATIVLHQTAFPVRDSYSANRFFSPEYLLLILVAASSIVGWRAQKDGAQKMNPKT